LVIGLGNLIGIQILVSQNKEIYTLVSTSIGAVVNFSLNLLLIPYWGHNGAAIATLIAEISVTTTQIYFARSYLKGNFNFKNIREYLLGSVLIIFICRLIGLYISNVFLLAIISIPFSIFIYFLFLNIIKNEYILEIKKKIIQKINSYRIS
jgi:O-antigen/teichoic acid export membrane protein